MRAELTEYFNRLEPLINRLATIVVNDAPQLVFDTQKLNHVPFVELKMLVDLLSTPESSHGRGVAKSFLTEFTGAIIGAGDGGVEDFYFCVVGRKVTYYVTFASTRRFTGTVDLPNETAKRYLCKLFSCATEKVRDVRLFHDCDFVFASIRDHYTIDRFKDKES